jgi:triacylglycerol lipase
MLVPVGRRLAAAPANPVVDLDLAMTLGGFCEATYVQLDSPGTFRVPSGYDLVAKFTGTDQQHMTAPFGFIAESAAAVVIAFRGTQTTTEWITNADFGYTSYPFAPGAGYSHAGFLGIYASMRGQIIAVLRKLPGSKQLYLTGHSLGAALSTLHALDAAVNTPFHSLTLYNFASPRVGDGRFAVRYDQTIGTSIRFVNAEDIVPRLPTTTTGYRHVKAPWTFSTQTGSRDGNHALTTYLAGVRKAQGR